MRTISLSVESLLINYLPSIFISIFTLIIMAIWLIRSYNKIHHKKGVDRFVKWTLVPICFGILLIILGYMVSLNSLKYTHGTEETTATITYKDVDRSYSRRARRHTKYTYTIKYIDNEVTKKAKLHTIIGTDFEVGDKISVYYLPDDNNDGDSYDHLVVAVDFEKSYADKYITTGMFASLLGLSLLVFLKIKEDSINKGTRITAKVIQISPADSKLFKENKKYDFICQGRDPATQLLTNYTTTGVPSDFTLYDPGSEVTVMVSIENTKKYFISL